MFVFLVLRQGQGQGLGLGLGQGQRLILLHPFLQLVLEWRANQELEGLAPERLLWGPPEEVLDRMDCHWRLR